MPGPPEHDAGMIAVLTPQPVIEPLAVAQKGATKKLGLTGWLAAGWLSFVAFVAIFTPLLPLADPDRIFPGLKQGAKIAGPGTAGHLLGGDASGHDLLARTIWGSRASLVLGVASVLVGLLAGGALGLVAGYYRGKIDVVVSMVLDTMLAIPPLVLALAFVAVFAPFDLANPVSDTRRLVILIIALGIVSVPILGRITRASTLTWSQREFVLASRALGAKDLRIIAREILPNVLPAMFSITLLGIAVVITAEGGLSILGIGIQGTPSWGNIIAGGSPTLRQSPWPIVVPSVAIFLTVLSLNYLGDVVRARSDVRESML
jgi:peptide/nickel transport system permease protein